MAASAPYNPHHVGPDSGTRLGVYEITAQIDLDALPDARLV